VTKLCNDTYWKRENKSLQLGLHHFNPPPNASSCKGFNEVLPSQRRKSLGVEQGVHTFKDKGMQTQYEVKFLQNVFYLKVELFNLPKAWI